MKHTSKNKITRCFTVNTRQFYWLKAKSAEYRLSYSAILEALIDAYLLDETLRNQINHNASLVDSCYRFTTFDDRLTPDMRAEIDKLIKEHVSTFAEKGVQQ